jgi:hypothetical protein
MPPLHLATFSADVTPPDGHPLCGGWIEPVRDVEDPLKAVGVVLLGMGQPVVLCAVDWCGLRNDANLRWRAALAKAAHTVVERVAVHCVHQHNAPFADVHAERLLRPDGGAAASLDLAFFERVIDRTAGAVMRALAKTSRFTHIGIGHGTVREVASNRRVLGDNGQILTRYSACRDAKLRAAPEGLIDPVLRTLSFWDGETPLAALHYYAVHPMSYYGDGVVTSDFAGLARELRREDDPRIHHVYFTGCAGNITAGKYNDGCRGNRKWLRNRIHAGMAQAWAKTAKHAVQQFQWRVEPVRLPPRGEATFGEEQSRAVLTDANATRARRHNAAFQLAWLRRLERPIELTCLGFGRAQVLHLPGEPFIEYQLRAQQVRKDSFVCVAGYGDGGPGYIPTAGAYVQGGYEPTVSLCGPRSEEILHGAMDQLLRPRK